MRIVRNLQQLKQPLKRAVLTIGNFDGVHLGHREIFRHVVQKARQISGTAAVLTFFPHPQKYLAPASAPPMINTVSEKERLIAASCVDVLICLPFDAELASLPAARFVQEILVKRVGVRHLVVGYDYAFGRGRQGNIPFLQEQGRLFDFTVEVLPPIAVGAEVYSSTRIRQLVQEGKVDEVVGLLGRNFSLEGIVVSGVRRGHGLGFPTANLKTEKELLPCPGVYAVKVKWGRRWLNGVVNIGCNPTFGPGELSLEVHLLDFAESIYGETLRLYFVERLRDEMRFPSPERLTAAIREDIRTARGILASARVREYREVFECASDEEGGVKGEA